MFNLGMQELLIIGAIAVILFGKKLPEVARSLGGSYREFRRGLNEMQAQMQIDDLPSRPTTPTYNDFDDYDEPSAPKFEPPPAKNTMIAAEDHHSVDASSGEPKGSQTSETV